MATVIWGVHGVFLNDFLPENTSFNSSYFIKCVLSLLVQKNKKFGLKVIKEKFGYIWTTIVSTFQVFSIKKTEFYGFKKRPHPPYSLDVAPSNFFLFGYTKNKLKRHTFI